MKAVSRSNRPMMSLRALPLVSIALAPLSGSQATALDFYEAGGVSCKSFIQAIETPLHAAALDPIVEYLSKSKEGPAFGSACNIGNYVRVACEKHPSYNVRQAVAFLLVSVRRGLPLPTIPRCGA